MDKNDLVIRNIMLQLEKDELEYDKKINDQYRLLNSNNLTDEAKKDGYALYDKLISIKVYIQILQQRIKDMNT